MRLFTRVGYRPKRIETKKQSDGLLHLLALSAVGLCACLICLCGVSWAWFTATTSTGTTVIQSSSYKLTYQVDDAAPTDFTEETEVTVPESGPCSITLSATGTAGAAGYCSVQVGDKTYYTKPIFVGDNPSAFTFTVNAAKDTKIILTPKWGSYSGNADLNSGDTIGNTTGNTQQENPVAAATTAEPAEPTTTTAAPSRSPEESAASTPDAPAGSATAQPEGVTGGEQAPAPEDSNR